MRIAMDWHRPQGSGLLQDGRILGCTLNKQDGQTVINIRGEIGDEWSGVTASQLVDQVREIDTPITLKLNTPGGLIDDALEIYDSLREHPYHVKADIVARAWSAGTIISAAADEVRIAPAAVYGIHCAWSGFVLVGNARELRAQIPQIEAYCESLGKLDLQIAEMLAERTENSRDQVLEWMVGEEGVDGTEFVGVEAVKVGFADSMIKTETKGCERVHEDRARSLRLAQMRARAQWV